MLCVFQLRIGEIPEHPVKSTAGSSAFLSRADNFQSLLPDASLAG